MSPRDARPRPGQRGFTLIELLLALTLVAVLVGISFGALRVGFAAWRQGEDRAESEQHARGLAQVMSRSLMGAFPYRGESQGGAPSPVLFLGEPERLTFVSAHAPFPTREPIAFTAVTFVVDTGERPGLAIRQKALPNNEPFEPILPATTDPAVSETRFRYLGDGEGAWQERWDADQEKSLPRAVEVTLVTTIRGKTVEHPPLVIPLAMGAR